MFLLRNRKGQKLGRSIELVLIEWPSSSVIAGCSPAELGGTSVLSLQVEFSVALTGGRPSLQNETVLALSPDRNVLVVRIGPGRRPLLLVRAGVGGEC